MIQPKPVCPVRRWGRRLAFSASLLLSASAFAQSFPARPIRIVVPYAPTGILDIIARYAAGNMAESMGQQVIVENKPGAGGIIAAQYVAKAPADGHTIFFVANSDYAITPALHMNKKLPYDPARDFAPVTQAVRGYMSLITHAGFAGSVSDVIAQAKAKPGAINYGSPGSGTMHHLGMEQFKRGAKVDLLHVPYKGVTQATPALVNGDISVMFATMASVASFTKGGQLKVLAVASPQRSASRPDLPTVAETIPGFVMESNMGFVVPAGTPRPIIDRLNAEIAKAMQMPNMKAKLQELDVELALSTPEQFGEQFRKDQEFYARLVRDIGLNID
ncbi:MAG: Tripartite tricarboxylate transporter family receptor [Noviherbaspirillum sp.]|nr:Tripartite tricarboxylate transporter family receptor [Noviherbaspirillum sp.]